MYYLPVFNRGLFNRYYCYGLFLPFKKTFKCYEQCFIIQSLHVLEKSLLVNEYKKQMCQNSYLFDVMKDDFMFSSKVCHFQYDNRFLFSREIERNIRKI